LNISQTLRRILKEGYWIAVPETLLP